MNKLKTLAVLSFIALLSFGVASCFNPSGPGTGNGGNGGDTIVHGKKDTTHIPKPPDTLIRPDTFIKPPPPPPPDSGGLDTNQLDSLFRHHK
jgi:hypothetical protein